MRYLWQVWFARHDRRARRLALQSAVEYCKSNSGGTPEMVIGTAVKFETYLLTGDIT